MSALQGHHSVFGIDPELRRVGELPVLEKNGDPSLQLAVCRRRIGSTRNIVYWKDGVRLRLQSSTLECVREESIPDVE